MFRRIGIWGIAVLSATSGLAEPAANAVKLMAFNVRYASEQPPNAWPLRRPVMADLIRDFAPDVMGTQEGTFHQLKDLANDLPDYAWVGLGRKGGSQGEFCAVFYRRYRFELMGFDHFWLSDTPEITGSVTWGHKYVRMATWVHLQDRRSGQAFVVLNTHFDHQSETARRNAAELIKTRLTQIEPGLPQVVMGDFNCAAETSAAFKTLTLETGLTDSWTLAAARDPEKAPNTFHGYQPPRWQGERIDWILVEDSARVTSARILTDATDGQYPSDHFPVTATVIFEP